MTRVEVVDGRSVCAIDATSIIALDDAQVGADPDVIERVEIVRGFPYAVFQIADTADPFEVVDRLISQGLPASVHHLMAPAQVWKYGPAVGPGSPLSADWIQLPGNYPQVDDAARRIVIFDTGGSSRGAIDSSAKDQFEPTSLPDAIRGHGTFVKSIANAASGGVSPTVLMKVSDAKSGLVETADVVEAVLGAELAAGDIINMSLGTYPCREGRPPIDLVQMIADVIENHDGVDFVAAAGNDEYKTDEHAHFYPAGFGLASLPLDSDLQAALDDHGLGLPVALHERVASVGATQWNGQRWEDAWYSNRSEVQMPGTDLVGHHPDGTVTWSGTSFAAPNFAACLAVGACDMP